MKTTIYNRRNQIDYFNDDEPQKPKQVLFFLVDTSESMKGSKIDNAADKKYAKETAELLLKALP